MATPRQWFRDALTDFKTNRTGNNRRTNIRADVAALVTAGNKWLNDHDRADNVLEKSFIEDKRGQFNTFVDAQPITDADQEP